METDPPYVELGCRQGDGQSTRSKKDTKNGVEVIRYPKGGVMETMSWGRGRDDRERGPRDQRHSDKRDVHDFRSVCVCLFLS